MTKRDQKNSNTSRQFHLLGLAAVNLNSALNYAENVKNNAPRGHGFAAERANHHIDQLLGKGPRLVGADNARNGADRLVRGVAIQSKYCATGSRCISECFDDTGTFRYIEGGKPMQIEVPKDLYDDAVQAMGDRIRNGKVPGVTDPNEARNLVRKGHITYKQAVRIAQAGSIEGLTFDAVRGVRLAGSAAGISSAVSFATTFWQTRDARLALQGATQTGLQVGGVAWVTSILTAQVGRTGLEKGMRSSTDFVVKKLGPKTTQLLANSLRSGNDIYGAAAASHLSKVMRGNIVTTGISVVVLTSLDAVKMLRGQLTGAQLMKNATVTTVSTASGTAAVLVAAPLVMAGPLGWGILALVGAAGGAVGGAASKAAMDQVIRDDGMKLQEVLEAVIGEQTEEFMLSERELNEVLQGLPDQIRTSTRAILTASDPRAHALESVILPLLKKVTAKRPTITLPDTETFLGAVEAHVAAIADDTPESDATSPANTASTLHRFLPLSGDWMETLTALGMLKIAWPEHGLVAAPD
ncbi:hypothetical protein [Deinococcus hohokamensis]|uniref:Uncharacterized protein n=1 Tax=Deinococcus hohokamensis TaxID=309883 RepID=A0ABV9ICI3_9DEIO